MQVSTSGIYADAVTTAEPASDMRAANSLLQERASDRLDARSLLE